MENRAQPSFDPSCDGELASLWEQLKSKFQNRHELLAALDTDDHGFNSQTSVQDFIQRTRDRFDSFQDKRKDSFGHRATTLCDRLSSVLRNYTWIADCLKAVHPNGGPIAYGIFALIVGVVGLKKGLERTFLAGLIKVDSWMEDLNDYQAIWADITKKEGLTKSAVAVYKHMVHFVTDVWDYCTGTSRFRLKRSLRRLWEHTREPELDELQDAIKKFYCEARKLAMQHVRDLERQDWKDMISSIQHKLQYLSIVQPGEHFERLRKHQVLLAQEEGGFDEDQCHNVVKQKCSKDHEILRSSENFRWWLERDHSCMLLLRTINNADSGPDQQPEWVAAPLSYEAAEIKKRKHSLAIFHAPTNTEEKPQTLIAAVVTQVLDQDLEFFRRHKQSILNILPLPGNESPTEKQLEVMKQLLFSWCREMPHMSTYIVVVGLDTYLRRLDTNEASVAFLKMYLVSLLDAARESAKEKRGILKICFHCSQAFWKGRLQLIVDDFAGRDGGILFRDSGPWYQVDHTI